MYVHHDKSVGLCCNYEKIMDEVAVIQIAGPESGFINSQPSIVEFMTSLPMLDQGNAMSSSSIGNASSGTNDDLNTSTYYEQNLHGVDLNGLNMQDSNSAEYAWMKDKKAARKNNQHRNCFLYTCLKYYLFVHK